MIDYAVLLKMGRVALDVSQEELANRSGISRPTIVKIESGGTASQKIKDKIEKVFQRNGIVLTENGIEIKDSLYSYNGATCFMDLLDDVYETLMQYPKQSRVLYISDADDSVSPAHIVEKYNELRANGVEMRQTIEEGNSFILGNLDRYRTVPKAYFENFPTLIFGHKVAVKEGDKSYLVHRNANFLSKELKRFQYFWDKGLTPTKSTATERFSNVEA